MIHIYAPALQPATGWIDTHSGEPMHSGFPPEALIYTNCCTKRRMAKDCVVQMLLRRPEYFLRTGPWCKDPAVSRAEKKRPRVRQSQRGAAARWKKNGNNTPA